MIEFLDSVSLRKLVDEQLARACRSKSSGEARDLSQPVVKPIKITAPNSCSRSALLSRSSHSQGRGAPPR